ncbi:uncharacterized protein EV154DRAFT_501699, partial [Mucor mucedo]|uniref:uncharacterized protein n=1 Tax=Mucor mucedo TaxID=29922 RepID=UPI002220090F
MTPQQNQFFAKLKLVDLTFWQVFYLSSTSHLLPYHYVSMLVSYLCLVKFIRPTHFLLVLNHLFPAFHLPALFFTVNFLNVSKFRS